MIGSAAGALIGLQFVVMTLIADRPSRYAAEAGGAFATPTIAHFTVTLILWSLPAPSCCCCSSAFTTHRMRSRTTRTLAVTLAGVELAHRIRKQKFTIQEKSTMWSGSLNQQWECALAIRRSSLRMGWAYGDSCGAAPIRSGTGLD